MNPRFYPLDQEVFDQEIQPLIIASQNRSGRPVKVSHYTFFCAILYVLRTGVSWRDLPSSYGPWHTIYTRFKRWSENGLFWQILYQLQQQKKITLDFAWIDSTTLAIHRHGSGPLKKRDLKAWDVDAKA